MYHFKRTFLQELLTNLGSSGVVNRAYFFSFSMLPNVSEFTTLFDRYRINKVVIKFVPGYSNTVATSNPRCQFITAVDYDDASLVTSTNNLLEYDTKRIHDVNRIVVRKFTPACAQITGLTQNVSTKDVSTRSRPAWKVWLDCANDDDRPHYGLKCQWSGAGNQDMEIRVWITLYFSCAAVR